MIFSDSELATTGKALDIHRQSLIAKLQRLNNSVNEFERNRTLGEIKDCDEVAARIRSVQAQRLAES